MTALIKSHNKKPNNRKPNSAYRELQPVPEGDEMCYRNSVYSTASVVMSVPQ